MKDKIVNGQGHWHKIAALLMLHMKIDKIIFTEVEVCKIAEIDNIDLQDTKNGIVITLTHKKG